MRTTISPPIGKKTVTLNRRRDVGYRDMEQYEYTDIVKHYERCLLQHGPTHAGMDWPDAHDLKTRFDVMLAVMRPKARSSSTLLDIGCGAGLLIDRLKARRLFDPATYRGIDLSREMVAAARRRHPSACFEVRDILLRPLRARSADYIIMNGVLTEKLKFTQAAMEAYACRMIKAAFNACSEGVAFNVMSSHVDWRRRDLFHWPLDRAVKFLVDKCSRHIVIRMDYGLYEYTIYVYRKANGHA